MRCGSGNILDVCTHGWRASKEGRTDRRSNERPIAMNSVIPCKVFVVDWTKFAKWGSLTHAPHYNVQLHLYM